jgi:hypothetical protein
VFFAVSTQIEELGREQRIHPVLLLDEAHLLHQDTLEHLHILLNYEWDRRALLSLVLVGLPELEDRLAMRRNRSLWSRIHHRLRIDPLTVEDTAAYLRERRSRSPILAPIFRRRRLCCHATMTLWANAAPAVRANWPLSVLLRRPAYLPCSRLLRLCELRARQTPGPLARHRLRDQRQALGGPCARHARAWARHGTRPPGTLQVQVSRDVGPSPADPRFHHRPRQLASGR